MDEDSIRLLEKFREGDSDAADALFHRYVDRLVGLAKTRLSRRLAQRVDPEDVVQSVYRTFFANALKEGRYNVERTGDMWRLLAAITVNKVLSQAQHHRRQKRSIDREQRLEAGSGVMNHMELFAENPSLPEAVAVIDELQMVMSQLQPLPRTMLELRLQGLSVAEVATEAGRSERSVRKTLEKVRKMLEERLFETSSV